MVLLMAGAFQIARDIFNNPIWQNITEFRLFFLIVGNAIYLEEGKEIAGIQLKRGQWLRSYRNLQADLEYLENHAVKRPGIATVKRAVDNLINDKRISIEATEHGTLFTVLNYEKYQDLANYKIVNMEQIRNTRGTDTEHSRNNNKKDNKGKKENTLFVEGSDELEAAKAMFRFIKKLNPDYKEPNYQSWARVFDAIFRIDKKDLREVQELMVWVYNDNFWKTVILSPSKFREKYDSLNTKRINLTKQQSNTLLPDPPH